MVLESEITGETLAKEFKEHSVAEFFKKNRQMLGLSGKIRTLTTIVHEYVTNSLDACEEAHILPEIELKITEKGNEFYEVMIKDNGPGLTKDTVGKALGKLLAGTKFHRLIQSRGQQGIGAAGVTMLSQVTTGKETQVITGTGKGKPISLEISIDAKNNEPKISNLKQLEKEFKGTAIKAQFKGVKYINNDQSPLEYLRRTALANPHSTITFVEPSGNKNTFERTAKKIPSKPLEVKPHPNGVSVDELITISRKTDARKVSSFLKTEFDRMGDKSIRDIEKSVSFDINKDPKKLAWDEAEEIINSFKKIQFIAPRLDALRPIGEQQIRSSMKAILEPEFVSVVTRKPQVYSGGFPFQVECCTGDTIIVLEDGELIEIKDYVEKDLSHKKVYSMDDKMKIIPSKVIAIQKFKNENKILEIKTRSGRKIKVTGNNEMPVIEKSEIIWVPAEQLFKGDLLATPKIIQSNGTFPNLLDSFKDTEVKIIDRELISQIILKLLKKYKTKKETSVQTGIPYERLKSFTKNTSTHRPSYAEFKKMCNGINLDSLNLTSKIKKITIVDTKVNNPKPIKNPELTEDLLYILGLLKSDGYISRREIQFINKNEKLHELFSHKIRQTLGLKVYRYKKTVSSFSNKTAYLVFENLFSILTKLPNNLIASFLKGFVDGDGWVSLRKGEKLKEIGIATAKEEKAELIQYLLLRLGITSKIQRAKIPTAFGKIDGRIIKTKQEKFNIIIKDLPNMLKFNTLITFRQQKRAEKLLRGLKNIEEISGRNECLPVGNLIKQLRGENNLHQHRLGISGQSIRMIESGKQLLTQINLQKILKDNELKGQAFERLKLFLESDLIFEEIIDIQEAKNEEYVYDLTVENGNFVANNMIMHNCAIAYGGGAGRVIGDEKKVEIMRFANRAPLLFDGGGCAITKAVQSIDWRRYGIKDVDSSPLTVFVNLISVHIPYTSAGKQAISDEDEVLEELRLAIMDSARKTSKYIIGKLREKEKRMKREIFLKYIPETARALSHLSKYDNKTLENSLEKMVLNKLKLEEKEEAEANGENGNEEKPSKSKKKSKGKKGEKK